MKYTAVVSIKFSGSGDKKALEYALRNYDGGVEGTMACDPGSASWKLVRVNKIQIYKTKPKRKGKK